MTSEVMSSGLTNVPPLIKQIYPPGPRSGWAAENKLFLIFGFRLEQAGCKRRNSEGTRDTFPVLSISFQPAISPLARSIPVAGKSLYGHLKNKGYSDGTNRERLLKQNKLLVLR